MTGPIRAHLRLRKQSFQSSMTVVTTLSPVCRGEEAHLARALGAVQQKRPHPMAVLTSTHFARYVVIDSLGRGFADSGRYVPPCSYLLFSAVFDGRGRDPQHAYFSELRAPAYATTADDVWSHCAGYPGTRNAAAFIRYLTQCSLPTLLLVPGYRETVPEVRAALEDHRRVVEFAMRTQDMPDSGFAAELPAFLATVGGDG